MGSSTFSISLDKSTTIMQKKKEKKLVSLIVINSRFVVSFCGTYTDFAEDGDDEEVVVWRGVCRKRARERSSQVWEVCLAERWGEAARRLKPEKPLGGRRSRFTCSRRRRRRGSLRHEQFLISKGRDAQTKRSLS